METVTILDEEHDVNITKLYLSANSLLELPSELQHLTQLTYLDISNNQLTELQPTIQNLTQLTYRSSSYQDIFFTVFQFCN